MIIYTKAQTHKNGFFSRSSKWSPLLTSSVNNGFILQKIDRRTNASPNFIENQINPNTFNHSYFEAWEIIDKRIIYNNHEDKTHDDEWSYISHDYYEMIEDYIKKYNTYGTIVMTGTIYSIHKNSEAYNYIKKHFSQGKVSFAGTLLSDKVFPNHLLPKSIHTHSFSHHWNFQCKQEFIDSLITELQKINYNEAIGLIESMKEYEFYSDLITAFKQKLKTTS